eukprot:7391998-Prymnesium_polylepis.4
MGHSARVTPRGLQSGVGYTRPCCERFIDASRCVSGVRPLHLHQNATQCLEQLWGQMPYHLTGGHKGTGKERGKLVPGDKTHRIERPRIGYGHVRTAHPRPLQTACRDPVRSARQSQCVESSQAKIAQGLAVGAWPKRREGAMHQRPWVRTSTPPCALQAFAAGPHHPRLPRAGRRRQGLVAACRAPTELRPTKPSHRPRWRCRTPPPQPAVPATATACCERCAHLARPAACETRHA